jgi:gluconokinase
MTRQPALLICMGVSGAGKSTVARYLARELDMQYIEADDFHGEQNRARMAAGLPLDDAMREPWIRRVCTELEAHRKLNRDCVLACSGLRKAHRQRFRELGFRTCFLSLEGDREVIASRIARRKGHFYPVSLLDSQYADLEPFDGETDVACVDINADLHRVLIIATALASEHLNPESS